MISGWIWHGHVLGRLCEIHTHTFLLYSLYFWTVIVHTFTAFKRCNDSHGTSFPQKTMCFSPSHSFSRTTAGQKYSTKTESQLENVMKPYKYLTTWNHHHNSQQNDKKTFPNAAEVFVVTCESTAPMLVRLRKKTMLWGNTLSNNPQRHTYSKHPEAEGAFSTAGQRLELWFKTSQ